MTPRELRDEIAVATANRRVQIARDVSLAWHMANFGIAAYVGTLPDLDALLRRVNAGPRKSSELNLEAALIGEQLGVPMRPISEAAKRALLKLSKES